MSRILYASALALVLAACAHDGSDGEPTRYAAELRPGVTLDDAPVCDVETVCPDGLSCMYVDLGNPDDPARCVDPDTICDLLECGDGACLALESYPAQVMCEGPADDPVDGDDPDVSARSPAAALVDLHAG
jgi:hypothetical protein